jgi:hypothetical protein
MESNIGEMTFLDIYVSRKNEKLETKVYRKPIHSNRYLNFHSYHSIENKKSVIRTLAHNHNSNNFHDELEFINKTLVKNNYPKKLIDLTIKETIDKIEGRTESRTGNSGQALDHTKIIIIPYISEVSQKIKHILNKYDFKTVYKKGTSMRSILTRFKHIDSLESHDLVYYISCNDCDANYSGNTKRKLETRVKEHESVLYKPYVHSNIAEHSLAMKHDINWKNPKII